ncbi:MAG: hypothetical protein AABZ60_05015 [Planctomycetota bacterium]
MLHYRTLFFLMCGFYLIPTFAGGGPENLFLVVNRESWPSMTIANEYILLRKISTSHVLYLRQIGNLETIPVQMFREQILKPVLAAIQQRQLSEQIDTIVFSSDIPYSVDLSEDVKGEALQQYFQPSIASLTGVTYLADLVLEKKGYLDLDNNWYFCPVSASDLFQVSTAGVKLDVQPPRAFSRKLKWDPKGNITEDARGRQYYLCTILGVTIGRGNSVPEILNYLRRGVQSETSRPSGTIYYLDNEDVRAKTRRWGISEAIQKIQQLKVKAVQETGTIPQQKSDVLGAHIGISDFNWPASKSVILPGAICEHLTSFGGVLQENSGQTPLTEFLKNGASGASGTVVEPYAIQHKFPTPFIQYYYAAGSSLAEAFYQSVRGPYQLLIVGDPLCQPFASVPSITVDSLKPFQTIKESLSLLPKAKITTSETIESYEFFLDGVRQKTLKPEEPFTLDSTLFPEGYHELRIVAISTNSLKTQGNLLVPVIFDHSGTLIKISKLTKNTWTWNETLLLKISCEGSKTLTLFFQGEEIAQLKKSRGEIKVPLNSFGEGTISLQVQAQFEKGKISWSEPIVLKILPPWIDPEKLNPNDLQQGMSLVVDHGKPHILSDLEATSLQKANWQENKSFTLKMVYQTPQDEVYYLQCKPAVDLTLQLYPWKELISLKANQWNSVALPFKAGYHSFTVQGLCKGSPDFRFGGPGMKKLTSQFLSSLKETAPDNPKNPKKKPGK